MQTILIKLCLMLCLATPAGVLRAESAATGGEAATEAAPVDETSGFEQELLDPYVITPQQKARLDAERESGRRHADPDAAAARDAAPAQTDTAPAAESRGESAQPAVRPELHPLIRSFLESRYGQEHCSAPSYCENLVELQCVKDGDGPIYYYNNDNGRLLMTCGRACLDPDPYDERDCKKCPYIPWVDCQERAWREEQERLRRAREEEIAQLEAEASERQARETEILKQIDAIEQDCNARIRELQRELDSLQ
ncbi:uncharacterized protein FOKN1_1842 [Thiohalobacter thiocyanaticus]|uniref:Uncharacterized protein n=1 Tax=Thiohalobacter thiocyanaticus TaxID=585455 RepID=A0A1Z4VSA6_9GAMM|nr:hypothetical protein [Thiohalobacter thiocyanaticus]BAZ94228.1 uncharacterized protein FOKN1_1842 [Thiohalobacter thiocyanaticus]